jgi:hypothetical protein
VTAHAGRRARASSTWGALFSREADASGESLRRSSRKSKPGGNPCAPFISWPARRNPRPENSITNWSSGGMPEMRDEYARGMTAMDRQKASITGRWSATHTGGCMDSSTC